MLHKPDTNAIPQTALDPRAEVDRFHHRTAAWHCDESTPDAGDTILLLHRANFDLWHLEDRARDKAATDATLASVKRSIDRINQQRNNLVEDVDTRLLAHLAAASLPAPHAPLHSETPGLILDRLSILALKIFHTREEMDRSDASPAHIARNRERLQILNEQQEDLTACLTDLWHAICCGERRFKLYRQMKMYNDPELNPVLYSKSNSPARG